MKSISLYVDNGSWLCKVHPFTKLAYIATAISVPLLVGKLSFFAIFIALSLAVLASGRLLKRVVPLIAFSFTILITIFLIHGLFNQSNRNILFSIGPLHFYREGLLYALHIGCNVLNMLLSFAILVLSAKPSELVEELEKRGFSRRMGYIITSVFQIVPQMTGTMNTITDAQRSRGLERGQSADPRQGLPAADLAGGHELAHQHPGTRGGAGSARICRQTEKNLPCRPHAAPRGYPHHCRAACHDCGRTAVEDCPMPVIAVENLKYRYPNTESLALDGLSFTVEKGEFIGIVGENGAGKSTLSQALIGLVPQFYKGAYGGRVLIEDLPAETTPISELCCKVGLVFQNPFNQLSGAKDNVYEEVAFGMQNLGVPREEMHRRAEEALKLLDIWQYRDRNPFDLSGGQMQRVAIASVLVMNPDILVLDEPTSSWTRRAARKCSAPWTSWPAAASPS